LTRKKIKPQKPIRFIHLMNFSLRCCSILSDIPDTFWQSYKLSLHCHVHRITIYGTFVTISGIVRLLHQPQHHSQDIFLSHKIFPVRTKYIN
jgi:hypothetical protein